MKHAEKRVLFFMSGVLISTLFHNALHSMLQPAVPPAGQAASYWTQRALLQGGARTAPLFRRSFSTQLKRPQHISPQRWDEVTGDVENMTRYPQAYIDAESLVENPSPEKVEEITERSNQRYKSLLKKPSSTSLFSPARSPFLERSRPFSSLASTRSSHASPGKFTKIANTLAFKTPSRTYYTQEDFADPNYRFITKYGDLLNSPGHEYVKLKKSGLEKILQDLANLMPVSNWTEDARQKFLSFDPTKFAVFDIDLRNSTYRTIARLQHSIRTEGKNASVWGLPRAQAPEESTGIHGFLKRKVYGPEKPKEITEADIEKFINSIFDLEGNLLRMMREQAIDVSQWRKINVNQFYHYFKDRFDPQPDYDIHEGTITNPFYTGRPHIYGEPESPEDPLDLKLLKFLYQQWVKTKKRMNIPTYSNYKDNPEYGTLPRNLQQVLDNFARNPTVLGYKEIARDYDARDAGGPVRSANGGTIDAASARYLLRDFAYDLMQKRWSDYHTGKNPYDPAASWKQWQARFFGGGARSQSGGAGSQSYATSVNKINYPDDFYKLPVDVQGEIKLLAQQKDSKALKTEFHKLIMKYHPDTHPKTQELFERYTKIINNVHDQAKEILQQLRTE